MHLVLMLACTAPTDSDSSAVEPIPLTLELTASLTDRPLVAQVDVVANVDAEPWIELWSDDVERLRGASQAAGTVHSFEVPGLRQDATYTLVAVALDHNGERVESAQVQVTSGSVDMSEVTTWSVVEGQDVADGGITLFAPNITPQETGPFIWGVDRAGELVFALPSVWDDDLPAVRAPRMLPDGRFTLLREDGLFVLTQGGEIDAWYGAFLSWKVHHDGILLDDGTALLLGIETVDMDVPGKGMAPTRVDKLFRVDADTNVVWEWSAVDAVDPTFFPTDESTEFWEDGAVDWTHANSMDVVDDTVLISFRNLNQVMLVDLDDGQVLWTLGEHGDFELLSGDWFGLQHAATFVDADTVVLYDNTETGPTSRVVAYDIDTTAMTATQVRSWDAGYFTDNMGDVDVLEDQALLIAAAGRRPGGELGHLVELDAQDNVVWDLEIQTQTATYATERAGWLWLVQ
jgi:hypothetical protein